MGLARTIGYRVKVRSCTLGTSSPNTRVMFSAKAWAIPAQANLEVLHQLRVHFVSGSWWVQVFHILTISKVGPYEETVRGTWFHRCVRHVLCQHIFVNAGHLVGLERWVARGSWNTVM